MQQILDNQNCQGKGEEKGEDERMEVKACHGRRPATKREQVTQYLGRKRALSRGAQNIREKYKEKGRRSAR